MKVIVGDQSAVRRAPFFALSHPYYETLRQIVTAHTHTLPRTRTGIPSDHALVHAFGRNETTLRNITPQKNRTIPRLGRKAKFDRCITGTGWLPHSVSSHGSPR